MVCKLKMCVLPNIHNCMSLHFTKLPESPEKTLCVCVVCVYVSVKELRRCINVE